MFWEHPQGIPGLLFWIFETGAIEKEQKGGCRQQEKETVDFRYARERGQLLQIIQHIKRDAGCRVDILVPQKEEEKPKHRPTPAEKPGKPFPSHPSVPGRIHR